MGKRSGHSDVPSALRRVTEEVVRTFHHLRAASDQLHGQELSASQRGVLRDLQRNGAQTVSQMARARPVSRQFIQHLVDALVEQGLVEVIPNPAHARAHLVRLTAAGLDVTARMEEVEARAYRQLARHLDGEDLDRVAATLEKLRSLLEALPVAGRAEEA